MIQHRSDDPSPTAAPLSSGRTLLAFFAKWCGSCRALARTLRSVEPIVGIPVVTADVEESPDLAERFGVLGVPQLLYLEEGVEIGRASGSLDESEFAAWFAPFAARAPRS